MKVGLFYRLSLHLMLLALLSACAATSTPTAAPATQTTSSPTAASQPLAEATATEFTLMQADALPSPVPASPTPETVPQATLPTAVEVATSTPRVPPGPDAWSSMPITPTISENTRNIYLLGQSMGRNPHAFSKIGDCQNVSSYFLSPFAYPNSYDLGPHTSLQETIDWFQASDSFTRESLAVKGGFNVAAVLSPLRADPKACEPGESPLKCEIRLHNPSFAIISMETWWSGQPDNYERYMRQLLDQTIELGVVPILATKADNLEGENQINKVLTNLAWEYDIPLWNFWAAVQVLPNRGLTSDGFHLTLGDYFFNDPVSTATGWSLRNLTALQALDAVRRGVAP